MDLESTRVSIRELRVIERQIASVRQKLDELTRLRIEVASLERRIGALLLDLDEKTPVRPVSSDALKAFESSSKFLAVKPPRVKKP